MGRSTDVKAKFISDTTAADADGLITSTTPGAGGAITLNGAQVSGGVASFGDNTARLITVTCASDINARVFTITGTDANGDALTDFSLFSLCVLFAVFNAYCICLSFNS